MAKLPDFSDEAWQVIQGAKAVATMEGSDEILARHLFQGFVLKEPEVVRKALILLGLPDDRMKAYLDGLKPKGALPQLGTTLLALSARVESIIQRARELLVEYPPGPQRLIAPIHLWTGLCSASAELKDWLKDCGWQEEYIKGLARISGPQIEATLPKSSLPPSFTPRELEILNNFCGPSRTELARKGTLKPAFCMEHVTHQMVRCLLKKNRRNVVLTGPAGVGKTKLVDDLAVRIVNGEIPKLAGCEVFTFDLVLFTSGTHLMGSRAERWKLLREVLKVHPEKIILFIDEMHSIVGLPLEGQAMDLANALKPILGEGEVRIIGATTPEEYRRHIQGDPALERRFTEVKVPEPDKEAVLRILQEVSPEFEAKHAVVYARESLEAIYDFARIYVPNQAFPAKAIELMDEVGAEVYMQRQIQSPESQPPVIRQENLREVFRRIWGITPEGLSVDLADLLKERVVGQDHAVQELADIVITSAKRYGKERRRGPRAVILFIGPPGVGKSYTAQCLSEILFPGQNKLCTLDMTEFSGYHEAEHARFRLLGPPPPYVGWESGGLLTSHAIRNPVSVVLVDEFEKAGSAARNVFLRIFDEGWAQDGRGRIVSFREIYFILTANAGRKLWEKMKTEIGFAPPSSRGAQEAPSGVSREKIVNLLREEGFSPELLSRLSHIVRFNDLTDENLVEIARRKMSDFRDAALLEDQVLFQYDEQAFAEWLAAQCGPEKDVRRLGAVFESLVETPLAYWRTPRPEAGSVLELKPGPDRIELHPVTERDKFMRLLFVVASEAFEKKEKRWQREQAARVILGMGTSEKEVREGERKRSA